MAIVLKEYCNAPVNFSGEKGSAINITESNVPYNVFSDDSIMVDIEGIHVGPTRNFTWYTKEALFSSVSSWAKPYQKPLIMHHNETDGKIIGRVLNAEYVSNKKKTRSGTEALVFTCNVSEKEGVKGVQDGRLITTSIGVLAHNVKCSICGQDITEEGECEHERGSVYDGETCYWMIYSMEAKELSYVIVPSDKYAHNIKVYSPTDNTKSIKESVNNKGVMDMAEAVQNLKGTQVVEDAEKKQEQKQDDSIESLKATIVELNATIKELKDKLASEQTKSQESAALKESAESTLNEVNKQLREMIIDQVANLREQLGKPVIARENLEKRSKDSLMDSILDLKEETNFSKGQAINVTESVKADEEAKVEKEEEEKKEKEPEATKITKVIQESLLDADKDTSETEKKSGLDVKESKEISNISIEEDNIESILNIL